jgi:nitrogen fixation protein FixH
MTMRQAQKGVLTGKHVLAMFVVFFGFMLVMNGYMIWSAVTTFPGEDRDNPYLQGLNYNDVLARRADQSELSWTAALGHEAGEVVLEMSDREGNPVHGLEGIVHVSLLVDDHADQDMPLKAIGEGLYTTKGLGLTRGAWRLRVAMHPTKGDRDAVPAFETVKVIEVN